MRRNKGLLRVLAIVLALVTLVFGATFAWFTSNENVVNRFTTNAINDGSISIIEVFTPPDSWTAGQEVNKDVGAVNTGTTTGLVRMSLDELLSKLTTGKAVYTATDAINDSNNSGVLPVLFNNAAYSGGSWTELTAASTDFSNAAAIVPDLTAKGVTVYYNKQTAGSQTSYSFVAWSTIAGLTGDDYIAYNGKIQAVDAVFTVTRGAIDDSLAVTDIKFGTYSQDAAVDKDWLTEKPANTLFTVNDNGTAGDPDDDYLTAMAISDPGISGVAQIQLIFTNKVKLSLTGIQDGEWFYNDADGYFYYMGMLEGGNATSYFLDAVKLLDTADASYSFMKFNLTVKMEAIQNIEDALTATDSGGWGLTTGDLLTKMNTYCEI